MGSDWLLPSLSEAPLGPLVICADRKRFSGLYFRGAGLLMVLWTFIRVCFSFVIVVNTIKGKPGKGKGKKLHSEVWEKPSSFNTGVWAQQSRLQRLSPALGLADLDRRRELTGAGSCLAESDGSQKCVRMRQYMNSVKAGPRVKLALTQWSPAKMGRGAGWASLYSEWNCCVLFPGLFFGRLSNSQPNHM